LIDAIHYLCMSRSFVTSTDIHAIRRDHSGFELKGHFSGAIRPSIHLEVAYERGDGKKILVNGVPLDRFADLIGMVPVVVLSPEDRQLTYEGPEYRRSFLDSLISQVDAHYLQLLIEFRKVLRQRNKLLMSYRDQGTMARDQLEPWDIQYSRLASKIVRRRKEVLEEFSTYLERAYALMAGVAHVPSFRYKSFTELDNTLDTLEDNLAALLKERVERDLERGSTSIGPHRDEIIFYLDDMELRRFASQGQHRLFALSLKLAQLYFYSDLLDDLPIFLLDDVFGDLDPGKTKVLMQTLEAHPGQVCITAANADLLKSLIDFNNSNNRQISVEKGILTL
jgi:DNA replication and repair protein RecF